MAVFDGIKKIMAMWSALGSEADAIAQLKELRSRVSELERIDRERKAEEASQTIPVGLHFFLVLLVFFAVEAVIGVFVFGKEGNEKAFDYISYVLPVLAGAIAGFGLFNRKFTLPSFKLSVAVLIAGLVAFIKSKQLLQAVVIDSIGYAGLVISILLLWGSYRRDKEHMSKYDKMARPFYWMLLTVSLVLALIWCFVLWYSDRHALAEIFTKIWIDL